MRYGVLGPIEVLDDERVVRIGGPQQQRLLGVLLSQAGQVIETDRLVEALWPDGRAPEAATHSVLTYVHRLRTALGDGSIVTHGSGYSIEVLAGELDIDTFEALVAQARAAPPDASAALYGRALALWRGRAFGSLGDEWWALGAARRVEELRVVAAEERAAGLIATGHRAGAIAELNAVVAAHPLRERPVCLLADALHATGRQADALREFRAFRARLAEESGLLPSDELTALEHSIARGEVASGSSTAGRPLRGYVIHDAIGEGGFGRVYVATQPGTNRRVAIKVIRAELADSDEFVHRFEVEAQFVARLEHPHIVPLYDYWREPGGAYLVFRLLKHSAAASLVTGGPWSLSHVSQLVEEVGGALIAAHTAGVTHGDVRAANVLLDEAGSSYLTDFGIAVAHDTAIVDRTGLVTADIEDFAALLWELLAGTVPARSISDRQHVARRRRLPSLAGRVPGLPDAIDAVLAEATDPETRFESMAEFILAWRAAIGRPEGVVTPVGSKSHAGDSARRLAARRLIATAAAGVNPYQGLRSFAEADAGRYFGRDDVADALHDAVQRHRFVAVVGSSGSGKSSVVRAGLVPRLRSDNGRVVATMVPGDQPVAALRDALTEVAVEPIRLAAPGEALATVASAADGLVLIVDQLEECWTLASADDRETFLSALATAATTSSSRVHVVVVVRADFYDRPLQHPAIGRLVSEGTFSLPPMTPAQLDDAVVLPAAQAGVSFDEGVVAAIVAEAVVWPGALPMLQFTLAELYERRVDGRITAACLAGLGGIAGAVGQRAEAVFEDLDEGARSSVREVFARLVAPGQGAADTRRRARLGELPAAGAPAVDRFVAARLLVTDREAATREPVVEVAHEALLTRWPRLRDWVDEDRRWLDQLQHLATAARSWDQSGRPEAELYRGARLEAAIEALPDRSGELTDIESAFVEDGRALRDLSLARERRSTRRLRRLLVAASTALVVALLAGAIAVIQRSRAAQSARSAEIEALVGRIGTLRSNQRDVAALLAVEAFRLADTPRTRSALLSTFTRDEGFLDTKPLPTDNDRYFAVGLPDGEHALITTSDHRIRRYDVESGQLGEPWEAMSDRELRSSLMAVSDDGRLVAQIADNFDITGEEEVTIGVFDVASARLRFPPIELARPIGSASFSPDGSVLAVSGGASETVVAYSTADGRELGRLVGRPAAGPGERWVTAGLAFLDADQLAVGSDAGPVRIVQVSTMAVIDEIEAPAGTTHHLVRLDDGLLGHGAGGIVHLGGPSGALRWSIDGGSEVCITSTVIESIRRFYCADIFGRLIERDLATGQTTRRLDAQGGAVGALWSAAAGTELVAVGFDEGTVKRWRLDGTGPITRRLTAGRSPVRYSPDGTELAAMVTPLDPSFESELIAAHLLIDPATGDTVEGLDGLSNPVWHGDMITGVEPGADGLSLAFYDRTRSASVADGDELPIDGLLGGLDVGGPRAWAFYDADDHVEIWTIDTATRRRISPTLTQPRLAGDWNFGAAATRDGAKLAVARDGVVIYDSTSGAEIDRLDDGETVTGVHVTDTGVLIAWTAGGEVTMYDLDTLEPLRTLSGSRGYVQDMQSDSDGSTIATRGGDGNVTLYDVATGLAIGDPIAIPEGETERIALRLDGFELAIGGSTQVGMQIWDLDPEHWISAACLLAGRNLTKDEWETNLGDLSEHRPTCPQFPFTS